MVLFENGYICGGGGGRRKEKLVGKGKGNNHVM